MVNTKISTQFFDFNPLARIAPGKNERLPTTSVENVRYVADPQHELFVAVQKAISACKGNVSETAADTTDSPSVLVLET